MSKAGSGAWGPGAGSRTGWGRGQGTRPWTGLEGGEESGELLKVPGKASHGPSRGPTAIID